jgi:hypothetical protein
LENIIQEVLTYKMAKRSTMVILGVKEEAWEVRKVNLI